MKRVELIEKQIKRRYNRDVEVYRDMLIEDKEVKISDIRIIYKDTEYTLVEYLEDGQTDEVHFVFEDNIWKYPTHLEAEIHCMDLIGGE